MISEFDVFEMTEKTKELMAELTRDYYGGDMPTEEEKREHEQIIKDTLDAMGYDEVLEGATIIIAEMQAKKELARKEKDRLSKVISVCENTEERLRTYISDLMDAHGDKKTSVGTHNFSRRDYESVYIYDSEKIPQFYLKTTVKTEPDKTLLKKALENGSDIYGAEIRIKKGVIIK